ncbi:MAG: amidohydrolase family protein, partial [Actinomycetota bacterium]
MGDSPQALTIRNCDALIDGDVVPKRDIHIVDRRIAAIDAAAEHEVENDVATGDSQVIDGSGLLAMPGLINGHTHAAMTLLRGAAEDVPIESWFNDRVWPIEVNVTESDVHLGTLLACAEMIQAGVTSFADHYFHEHHAARAVVDSGLRANLGMTFFSSQGWAGLDASIEFVDTWHGAADGRITASLAPHATYTCTDDDLRAAAEAASARGVRVHIHAAESLDQTNHALAERGITPIGTLAETGILDTGVLFAHGCGIVESDLALLAGNATNIGVAHCPKTYMKLAINPLTPIR